MVAGDRTGTNDWFLSAVMAALIAEIMALYHTIAAWLGFGVMQSSGPCVGAGWFGFPGVAAGGPA